MSVKEGLHDLIDIRVCRFPIDLRACCPSLCSLIRFYQSFAGIPRGTPLRDTFVFLPHEEPARVIPGGYGGPGLRGRRSKNGGFGVKKPVRVWLAPAFLDHLCFTGREAGGTGVKNMGSGLRLPLSSCVSSEKLFEPPFLRL